MGLSSIYSMIRSTVRADNPPSYKRRDPGLITNVNLDLANYEIHLSYDVAIILWITFYNKRRDSGLITNVNLDLANYEIHLSYDVDVIPWITFCHGNYMTTRVITLWHVHVTSLTTSVSTMRFFK